MAKKMKMVKRTIRKGKPVAKKVWKNGGREVVQVLVVSKLGGPAALALK